MKYIILHILCEGSTEERFVKDVLAPYLRGFDIFAKPNILVTSQKKNAKGGLLSYVQAKHDLNILMKHYQDNDKERHIFTTMFDYYALPNDFPGKKDVNRNIDKRAQVSFIERMFGNDFQNRRFIPYIQLHEFEALLFTDIEKLKYEHPLSEKDILKLKAETDRYDDPEMINDSKDTAPSSRIKKALADEYNYDKAKSGAKVTRLIGMDALLNGCQHFREWITNIKEAAQA